MSIVNRTKDSVRFQHMHHRQRFSKTIKTFGMTKAEINKAHADWIAEIERGKFALKRYTIRQYSEKWLEMYVEGICRPHVAKNYRLQLKNHILPRFGSKYLEQITPMMINNYVLELKKTPSLNSEGTLSVGTIKKIYAVFKNIMNTAYQNDLIPQNPFSKVHLSFSDMEKQETLHFWDEEEVKKAIELLKQETNENKYLVYFALGTGLRLSEIFGLDWADIDFENSTITVNKSRQKNKGKMIELPCKTGSSVRKITIPISVRDMLLRYRMNHMSNKYVFSNLDPDKGTQWYRTWVRKSGLPVIRFHDLRHTHATVLLAEGVDIKTISKRLGHSNIGITMNVYTHVLEDLDRKASEAIDSVI